MITHLGAGKEVTLHLRAPAVKDGEAATFEILAASDGSVLQTLEGKVKARRASVKWTPSLEDDQGARRIRYEVRAGDRKLVAPEVEVYRDEITIISLDEAGDPLPDATYELVVGDETRRGHTGTAGEHVEADLPPGEKQLTWTNGFELVAWEQQGPAVWRAKLALGAVARIRLRLVSDIGMLPIAHEPFTLRGDGLDLSGETDEEGLFEHPELVKFGEYELRIGDGKLTVYAVHKWDTSPQIVNVPDAALGPSDWNTDLVVKSQEGEVHDDDFADAPEFDDIDGADDDVLDDEDDLDPIDEQGDDEDDGDDDPPWREDDEP